MTRDDIIRMAREAGLERNGYWEFDLSRLERFFHLAAAAGAAGPSEAAAEIERLRAEVATLRAKARADAASLADARLLASRLAEDARRMTQIAGENGRGRHEAVAALRAIHARAPGGLS